VGLDEFKGYPSERGNLQIMGMTHMFLVYVLFYIVWNLFKFLETCGITFDVNRGNLRDAKIPGHELNSFRSVAD